MPHVRPSVHGPKMMGAALRSLLPFDPKIAEVVSDARGGAPYLFRISRAIIRRWISLVPSPMVQSFTSR
jgi:hypothetical protein